ncbi:MULTISPECIES: AAA family ATPase [Bosea]|jgi:hypothetical protein|uniref:AAA+ ATPase domain-containing protein n=1 Tax=Bosea vaviloviae TaxID=1526658 RepID=A0A0N1FEN8_9HYPH|nr:AAA family ATPase [Bosea vaviloviae]KPH80821.1 hypothetical protein AE618_11375 [Bosea vaviloviae]
MTKDTYDFEFVDEGLKARVVRAKRAQKSKTDGAQDPQANADIPVVEVSAEIIDDSATTMAVYDHAAVERQIELLIGRPYYGDREEYLGSPLPTLNESDQARLDRLIGLHHDPRAGRRELLFGSDEHLANLARARRLCPGFEGIIDLIIRAVHLAIRTGTPLFVPPLLLVGPPGTGKTHASRQIASALRTDIHSVSCATNSDAQALVVGHPSSWKAARMGVLTEAMASGSSAQPVILLDEADKLQTHWSEKPYHTLLTLLERENSSALVDEFVRAPFNLSGAIIIATANDIEALPAFIIDRFTTFAIDPPVGKALLSVTRLIAGDVVAELRDAVAMPSDDVLLRAARHNPRRLGKLLRLAFGFAAAGARNALTVSDIEAAEALAIGTAQSRPIGFIHPMADTGDRGREGKAETHRARDGRQKAGKEHESEG